MSLLECKNVTKKFDGTYILKNVSLQIQPGRIVGLLGENGAGKSTLIKLINDLLILDEGTILIDGKPVGAESKQIVSYLPERTCLDKNMRVSAVLRYFEQFYIDFDCEKAKKLLADLGLSEEQKLAKMSKGMLEKLQLVLVMSRKAKLFILDEPLGGVDPATREYILDTILSNFDEGASILVSTHLIADVEQILDDVIFIDQGEVVLTLSTDELRANENASIDEIFRRMFRC